MTYTTVGRVAPAPGDRTVPRMNQIRERTLRHRLQADPNDFRSFTRLVVLLARVTTQQGEAAAPAAPGNDADDVAWALAAELAQHPRAWYPLVELARLSLGQDSETALRRLGAAVDRDPTGRALTSAVTLLRAAGRPDEAFRLAVARWRPHEHDLGVGRQLVLAGLESGRGAELRRHLDALSACSGGGGARLLLSELARGSGTRGGSPADPSDGTRAPGAVGRLMRVGRRGGRRQKRETDR
jgi:hypothetical protein